MRDLQSRQEFRRVGAENLRLRHAVRHRPGERKFRLSFQSRDGRGDSRRPLGMARAGKSRCSARR